NDKIEKLELQKIVEDWHNVDLEKAAQNFYSLPFYEGLLYSKDKSTHLLTVQVNDEALYKKRIVGLVEDIKAEITKFESENGVKVHASGLPFIRMANTKKVSKEIFLFIALSLSVTSLLLFFFLRSFKATFISLIVVILGVCWT